MVDTRADRGEARPVTVTSDVVFLSGLDQFGSVVDRMPASAWSAGSPCAGWTALDVLGHLGSAIGFGVAILDGRTYDWPTFERPSDLVDGAPASYWSAIATPARAAVVGVDLDATRATPMGVRTIGEGLAFPAVDLFVHAWDIGRAGGISVEVPDDVIAFAHSHIDPIPEEMMRGAKGAFGPSVAAPPDATPSELFLAWTGRSPR
jgi:uncharacterized protein (TIGR03086 family)